MSGCFFLKHGVLDTLISPNVVYCRRSR